MGWNDRLDEWNDMTLPDDATVASSDFEVEIDDKWLQKASRRLQKRAMLAWFLSRYCDPAQETPYISAEGGYIWIHGGPYCPQDELESRFGGIANETVLSEVINELIMQVGDDWAPIRWDDEYDEDLGVEVNDINQPFSALNSRLDEIKEVLTLTGSNAAILLAQKLAYSAVITALETYLWETMTYAVANDPKVARNIITKFSFFSDQKFSLGSIYSKIDSLESLVKSYLQDTVWHKWTDVTKLISRGLGIVPPSFSAFAEPTTKRHDIIHRSGHTKDGEPITVSIGEIEELVLEVKNFAGALEQSLREYYASR